MNWKSFLSLVLLGLFGLVTLVSGPGCANIVPPQGGPRDSLPPVLVKAVPKDSTLRFTGDRITLQFDEYVELDNYQQQMIVSPFPSVQPNVTRKLETVTVRFRDTLESNTTYAINFGRAIKDLNEGNAYRNFTYIFTTGDYFDSLEFRGNVIMAETGEVDTTLGVMLHRSGADSAVARETPRYVTKVDSKGNFRFRYLAPGTYHVYALKDESNRYVYMNPEQIFAFADSAIQVNGATKPVTLYAYNTPKEEKAVTSETGNKKDKRLKFITNQQGGEQDLLSPFFFTFEKPLRDFDSTKLRFTRDSAYNPVTNYSWTLDSTRRKLTLNYTWQENTLYHFILEKEFATDSLGQQLLKGDTLDFNTKKIVEYGKIRLRFKNLDLSKNPVLQFVQNKEVKKSFPLTSAQFTQDLFLPGEYNLRLLEDKNGNGKWDRGQFYGEHRQPELAKPLARKLTVKPNQDIPVEIDVNAPVEPDVPAQQQQRPGQRPQQQQRPATQPGNPPTRQPRLTTVPIG